MVFLSKDEKPAEETKQELIVVKPDPEPRLKENTKEWNEAMRLCDMLAYCRPNGSKAERSFIGDYIVPLGVKFDKKGNAHKIIGNVPVIWSCHTDTVHTKGGRQKIVYWTEGKDNDMFVGTRDDQKTGCLGADDTAGVWVMIQMIKAKVPGHYIFHRGEECGGIGSRWIAKENTEMLKKYQFAIAFDRKDVDSIITHQSGGKKSCSDEFAKQLAELLGLGHKPDATGMWTDTAAYVDEIAECTNVSVGYYYAHTNTEKLNVDYLFKLRDALCKIDPTKFVAVRKPGDNAYRFSGVVRYYDDFSGVYHSHSWQKEEDRPKGGFTRAELDTRYGYNDWYQWFGYDSKSGFWVPIKGCTPPNPKKWRKKRGKWGHGGGWLKEQADLWNNSAELRELKLLIQDNPAIIADLLDSQGYGPLEIRDFIRENNGIIFDSYLGM